MDIEKISDAIATHGAIAVYAAAVARMDGNNKPLEAMELEARTIGDADRIMRLAFEAMPSIDKTLDHASALTASHKR